MHYEIPPFLQGFIAENFPANVGKKITEFYQDRGYLPPSVSVQEGLINPKTVRYMPQNLFMALQRRNAPDTRNA